MRNDSDSTADALLARLIKLTRRREDFLTECFAAVLQADGRAGAAYWRRLTSELPLRVRTAVGPVVVKTQITAGHGSSRLDMVLSRGGQRIAVEHKLLAPQGQGQLPKYVALPRGEVSYVALVTGDYQQVSDAVLRSRRYARPRGDISHFLWADFYPLLKRSQRRGFEIATATRGLFDRLGLQPAHPLIGDLRTADQERRIGLDTRLYEAWKPLIDSLKGRRWRSVGSSLRNDRKSELYAFDGPSDLLREVWLDPMSSPSSLRIRLKTTSAAKRAQILDRVAGRRLSAEPVRLRTSSRGNHWAVELRVPWRSLLARTTTRGGLSLALKRFVLSLMRSVDKDAA